MAVVTDALFNLRIEALEAEKKEGERLLYKCALCNKGYTTAKAHANHLQSKLHVMRAAAADNPADAGMAGLQLGCNLLFLSVLEIRFW